MYIFFHPSIDVSSLKTLGNFHLLISDELLVADGSEIVLRRRITEECKHTSTLVVDMKQGDKYRLRSRLNKPLFKFADLNGVTCT